MIQPIRSYLRRTAAAIAVAAAMAVPSEAFAQFRWGAQAGVNVNNLKFKQELVSVDKSTGFSAGVTGEMMFPGIGFGLDIGLHYEMTGAKVHLGERKMWSSQGYGNEQLRMHYAVIPLHVRFKWTRLGGLVEIMRRWQLTAGYNMGMTYVVKAKVLTNYSARNRYWYVRGTYYF